MSAKLFFEELGHLNAAYTRSDARYASDNLSWNFCISGLVLVGPGIGTEGRKALSVLFFVPFFFSG